MGASAAVSNPVILFDGVCNLCNQSVLFVIKRDPNARFRFATLQSSYAQQQLASSQENPFNLQSVILLQNGEVFTRSRAALEIARRLSGGWPLLYLFIIVPPFLRNLVYDWIARNRYRMFGKKDACMIPTPELKARFIE